jgi:hypothetical protein
MNDLRFAIRQRLKNPALTTVAALTNFLSVLDVSLAIGQTKK